MIEKTQNLPIRILLIEDNPGASRLIQEMLNDADNFNFKLSIAENLVTGFLSFEESEIDIVLLDLSLPDSSGFQTIIRTREKTINIPIIVPHKFKG